MVTNHEVLKDLKDIFAQCLEGKRFCSLCMGGLWPASLCESRGKAYSAQVSTKPASVAFPRDSHKDAAPRSGAPIQRGQKHLTL